MLLQIAFDPNLFERGMITSVANHKKILYEELLVAACWMNVVCADTQCWFAGRPPTQPF